MGETYRLFDDWLSLGITAGMTTRFGGWSKPPYSSLNVGFHVGDDARRVLENRKRIAFKLQVPLENWVVAEQPHGTSIHKATLDDAGKGADSLDTAISGVDGLLTNRSGLLLVSLHADCVPLYFQSHKHHFVGIAHAGWKGTVGNIAGKMVERFKEEGVVPHDLHVAIGPAIGRCCYEVSEDVIDYVSRLNLSEPVFEQNENGKFMLDLKQTNRQLLEKNGVPGGQISVSDQCTSCERDLFYSHRREKGKTGRMMAFIGMNLPLSKAEES